jgi:hypothetical protein
MKNKVLVIATILPLLLFLARKKKKPKMEMLQLSQIKLKTLGLTWMYIQRKTIIFQFITPKTIPSTSPVKKPFGQA